MKGTPQISNASVVLVMCLALRGILKEFVLTRGLGKSWDYVGEPWTGGHQYRVLCTTQEESPDWVFAQAQLGHLDLPQELQGSHPSKSSGTICLSS